MPKTLLWIDRPAFTILAVARITGVAVAKLHQLVLNKTWVLTYPARRGKPKDNSNYSYTARDIVQALLASAAVASNLRVPRGDRSGAVDGMLNDMRDALNALLTEYIAGGEKALRERTYTWPRSRTAMVWAFSAFDLHKLIASTVPSLRQALRKGGDGVLRDARGAFTPPGGYLPPTGASQMHLEA
jgi:hypothetical protein